MRKRYKAFTLAEMLVVMGIIVLFIAMAIPAVRALTGSSSTSVARNEIASLLARAREEAVGIQDIRGVLFFIDPGSDRVVGIICQAATIQDPSNSNLVLLDVVPGRDSLPLPPGVRLQMLFNGTALNASSGSDDRFLGFNPLSSTTGSPPFLGGCVLFDGNGRTLVRQYGFQMSQPNGTGSYLASNLCTMINTIYPTSPALTYNSGPVANSTYGSYAFVPGGSASTAPYSQLGLVLFDYDAFKSQGFSDLDADINGRPYGSPLTVGSTTQTQSEQAEENWIDTNSTPVLINRFNGTLIRGE